MAALLLVPAAYLVVNTSGGATEGEITWIHSKAADVSFSKTEVTLAQFRTCVEAGACGRGTFDTSAEIKICNWGQEERGQHPMNCVSWQGATAFCRWAGGRLPTREEWTREASAGGARTYPWGAEQADCQRSVMHLGGPTGAGCRKMHTWPVCSKPRGNSVSGLCDMSGNVWEWTSSATGKARVLRGGAWDICTQDYLDATSRVKFGPTLRFVNLGFRCVRATR